MTEENKPAPGEDKDKITTAAATGVSVAVTTTPAQGIATGMMMSQGGGKPDRVTKIMAGSLAVVALAAFGLLVASKISRAPDAPPPQAPTTFQPKP